MEKLLKGLEKRINYSKKLKEIMKELGKEIYTSIPKDYEIINQDGYMDGLYDFGKYYIGVNDDYLCIVENNNYEYNQQIVVENMTGEQLVFLANNVQKYISKLTKKVDDENVDFEKALKMFK